MGGPYVLLLRGIGPATHKIITMTALAEACRAAGLTRVTNVLATGNLVVQDPRPMADVLDLARQTAAAHGLRSAILIRPISHLVAILAGDPDPDASALRPEKIQVTFLDPPLTEEGLSRLQTRATVERLALLQGELWVDYGGMIHVSKLTAPFIERVTGSVQTARNWRTLQRIVAAAGPS
jgi:uncharacterized protein (DUF1697 family)